MRGVPGERFWGIIDWGHHHQAEACGATRMSRRVPRLARGSRFSRASSVRSVYNSASTEPSARAARLPQSRGSRPDNGPECLERRRS